MRTTRSALTIASSVLVAALPLAITFGAARVYAEAGAAGPPVCADAKVATCADAGAMQACDCGDGHDCACTPSRCVESGGASRAALACEPVTQACSLYSLAPCAAKDAGAACIQTDTAGTATDPGTCRVLAVGCAAKNDAGFYTSTTPLACVADPPAAASATPIATTGSSCAMLPSRGDPGVSLVLGLGAVLALRRSRRRVAARATDSLLSK